MYNVIYSLRRLTARGERWDGVRCGGVGCGGVCERKTRELQECGKKGPGRDDWNLAAPSEAVHRDELSPKRPFVDRSSTSFTALIPRKKK